MKIDVTCTNCRAVLRVSREHAGKQVRCPSCGSLSLIPFDGEQIAPTSQPSQAEFGASHSVPTGSGGVQKGASPMSAPFNAPSRDPVSIARSFPETSSRQHSIPRLADGRDTTALILGGLAIASAFLCGCASIVLTPALSISGLVLANSSNGPSRGGAIVTNIIAIVIWIFVSLFWLTVLFII